MATVVAAHQATAALRAQPATAEMLAEQAIDEAAQAVLNGLAFTTSADLVEAMLEPVNADWQFDQLVESLVQEAARAAEQVAVTVTPRIAYVRLLNPPSCGRCAVLAGRIYRYSTGFLRHPGCDCSMIPTTVANTSLLRDPAEMAADGLVTGLSKADKQALADGADFNQIVNVRLKAAGLTTSGRVLRRGSRPTPEAIYQRFPSDRDAAIQQLALYGYIRT